MTPTVLAERIGALLEERREPVTLARREGRLALDGCDQVTRWFGSQLSLQTFEEATP